MKVLHAEARIFYYENFLSAEEADHIVNISAPRLTRSGVVANQGNSDISDIRTSYGTFLERNEDSVIHEIEERIARWTLVPAGNGEGLQVLRYHIGQKYEPHWDYFFHKQGTYNGGNRYATVLMYLADTEEGGETTFPNLPLPDGQVNEGFSECARHVVAVKPRKGAAVLFHSIKPSGELERRSLHGACPVIKGTKWSAAKWIHVGHYAMGGEKAERIEQSSENRLKKGSGGKCRDKNEMCEEWSSAGECDSNSVFMVGTDGNPGACLDSCNRCDLDPLYKRSMLSRKAGM
eukprot:CAMPEP_0175066742 /NCGR_PEP_ID=MMETSP0052_2-20121109/16690_1 /TAXON_ID=51329 ORGANISM="Polytomella parva, Strain SAG 63-3" /NCGR_SAMPLE_ID=MMETSP0052_2 /ASSEMBLY_ACC=CAM_ASM_000194 /LENGTH=290 /DNA_ID=CAMNT_0016333503 /DNA_START=318 /DNA_END=1187 /DNA_ORIENTATION=+